MKRTSPSLERNEEDTKGGVGLESFDLLVAFGHGHGAIHLHKTNPP